MIPVGTPCWIVYAPGWPQKVGRACVVTAHGDFGSGQFGSHNCKILVDNAEVLAGFKCLVPINPPERTRVIEKERELA